MIHLQLPTDPEWVALVNSQEEHEILTDHAYCEQKAASSCMSLIVQYPEYSELVDMLTPVVAEEWSHFESVLAHLRKRGHQLGRQRKDRYAVALNKLVRKNLPREKRLLDQLLVNALIEARSCERFKLLAKEMKDEELRQFYHDLMVSEARHYVNFIRMARRYFDDEEVDKRWEEFLTAEAEIIGALELRGDRMH
jgi:tRNA-(ms[2]io[6]A)-hydroxylase